MKNNQAEDHFLIPNFDEFAELLHDRLNSMLYYMEYIKGKFMLITILRDRDKSRGQRPKNGLMVGNKDRLRYAGTRRQRFILEKEEPIYKEKYWDKNAWIKKRDKNWDALVGEIDEGIKRVETKRLKEFRNDKLDKNKIKVKSLKRYFNEKKMTKLRKNELPIVSDYFDIQKDRYIGFPLLGAGAFQGMIWVIFQAGKNKKNKINKESRIRRIMKLFQLEYDNLILDWNLKKLSISKTAFTSQVLKGIDSTNPIQEFINIKEYYNDIADYYHEVRISQTEQVINKLKQEFLNTAIVTILLDSYAHNISAHSLTALSGWFKESMGYDTEQEVMDRELPIAFNNPISNYNTHFSTRNLSLELHKIFKFLLEKGAFWSGITRRTNFAGKVINLYDVLWHDFVNNPLYLGTIANTEAVRRLYINITIYERENREQGEDFKNCKVVKREEDGDLLDGCFSIINFDNFEKNKPYLNERSSPFVEKGNLYNALRFELEKFNLFFPGGIVGKHAFLTLLENEIRNVKHYKGADLQYIQEKGLVLNISIHSRPIDSELEEQYPSHELYKIGVWLKHPVMIDEGLLIRRIEGLDGDIVTSDTFKPKLGGNFQDKICGSVLMMSAFDQVQSQETKIAKIYYPWIKTACYRIREDKQRFEEFEVSHRKYRKTDQVKFTRSFNSEAGLGYLKKYFHMWSGAEILDMGSSAPLKNPALDSKARYRFIYLPENSKEQHYNLKSNGLIRIISAKALPTSLEDAYQLWLPQWLKKNEEDYVIDFLEGATRVGRITYRDRIIRFENESEIEDADWDDEEYAIYKAIPNRMQIAVEHGFSLTAAADKFNYRSHGEMITKFCEGKPMNQLKAMSTIHCFELFESLISRICIFDRRIYNRLYKGRGATENERQQIDDKKLALQIARLQLYRDHLHLNFQNELLDHFESVRSQDFLAYHFVVLHLSFIEGMIGRNGQKYGEEGIIDFIDEHILQGRLPESIGDDFVLIITTGRGRMAWWDKVKGNSVYMRFVTFRPIESIIETVENALQKPDDIDLKYNLTKLFFGS